MCARSKNSRCCRKGGTDPLVGSGPCTALGRPGHCETAETIEAHGCGARCRDLPTDATGDGYVRLGLPA
jgi:hypothetical protein